jgi:hypothetical protein
MDTPQWFYGRDGVRHGPVSEEELRRLAGEGELRTHDLVWRDGMATWQPAGQVAGLLPDVALTPPPIPAGPPFAPIGYANPQQRPPPQPGAGDDAGMRMLLPVGRSGWAIAAGYCGLLSLACWILGPAAILCGVMALRDMKIHPERHGMGRVITGFILGGVGTLILCAYGLTFMRRLLP